jgi:hypothetical protein
MPDAEADAPTAEAEEGLQVDLPSPLGPSATIKSA